MKIEESKNSRYDFYVSSPPSTLKIRTMSDGDFSQILSDYTSQVTIDEVEKDLQGFLEKADFASQKLRALVIGVLSIALSELEDASVASSTPPDSSEASSEAVDEEDDWICQSCGFGCEEEDQSEVKCHKCSEQILVCQDCDLGKNSICEECSEAIE